MIDDRDAITVPHDNSFTQTKTFVQEIVDTIVLGVTSKLDKPSIIGIDFL